MGKFCIPCPEHLKVVQPLHISMEDAQRLIWQQNNSGEKKKIKLLM